MAVNLAAKDLGEGPFPPTVTMNAVPQRCEDPIIEILMTRRPADRERTKRSRKLRECQTKAESLIWTVLRAKRLAGLKFRRQHPIGRYIVDFACTEVQVVIEIDGGYHEHQYKEDRLRQAFLESEGWQVLRFSNDDVLSDVESVAIAIARQVGVEARFKGRNVL